MRALGTRPADFSIENKYGRMLAGFLEEEALQPVAEYVRKCVLVEEKNVFDKSPRMKLARSELGRTRFFFSLSGYDRSGYRIKTS